MMKRWRIEVSGTVQGVFYRASTQRKARSLNLTGWVMNRPDGSVELEAQGDELSLKSLAKWCHEGPADAEVDRVSATPLSTLQDGESEFEIRR